MAEGDGISVRVAVPDDSDSIHRSIIAMGHHVGAPQKVKSTAADIRHHGFGDTPRFAGLIAEVDGTFAGMCLYFPSFSTWLGKPGVYVQDLFVDEAFRGRKVGERLIGRLAELTADEGGVYLRLSVDIDNISAQAFYSSLGMGWAEGERVYAAYGEAFLTLAARSRGASGS